MSLNTKGSLINLSYMVKRKFNCCRQIEILPVSVIARLFRKVTHQTCHSLNKHSPLHTRLFARLARPFFNSPLMLSFKLPCQRSCPALRCQIKSFWLESRIARLIIMLIGQFSVFFSLLPCNLARNMRIQYEPK